MTMNRLLRMIATVLAACPMGGQHERGTSGEWANRCRKCGQPC